MSHNRILISFFLLNTIAFLQLCRFLYIDKGHVKNLLNFILSMLIFPVFSLANYAEPLIFGMPFIMVWVLFWIIIEFLGLIVFVKIDKDIED